MEQLQIDNEIHNINEQILTLNNRINEYKNKIIELEDSYHALKKYQGKAHEYINQYNLEIVKQLDLLNDESTFKNSYKNELKNILFNYGDSRISDNVNFALKEILNQINEYEIKIEECRQHIYGYENEIQELKLSNNRI